jgi:hypothetical protein
MDPVTVIVDALAAGAAAGAKDSASSAVVDAYTGLKALARKRLGRQPDGELVLARHEQAPDTWQAPLALELAAAAAGQDDELITAAKTLLSLMGEPGAMTGNQVVDARGAYGVQVGTRNTQHIIVSAPPAGLGQFRCGSAGSAYP